MAAQLQLQLSATSMCRTILDIEDYWAGCSVYYDGKRAFDNLGHLAEIHVSSARHLVLLSTQRSINSLLGLRLHSCNPSPIPQYALPIYRAS